MSILKVLLTNSPRATLANICVLLEGGRGGRVYWGWGTSSCQCPNCVCKRLQDPECLLCLKLLEAGQSCNASRQNHIALLDALLHGWSATINMIILIGTYNANYVQSLVGFVISAVIVVNMLNMSSSSSSSSSLAFLIL